MALDGNRILEKMARLSQVERMKQVKPLSYALFPGYHCPLMGAMLTIEKIRDSVMLVVGPDECTFYTKMAMAGDSDCTVLSVVLDQHDVTFGCQPKLEEAFSELAEEYHPKAVYLVTTCVPEVTGDDVDSIAEGLEDRYNFPIIVVHAENFKTDDHLPGIEHTMDGSIELMEKQACDGSVNVLGLRLGDFRKSETARILHESGVPFGMMLPGECSIDQIRTAPKAAVNLVVHSVGLPLAQEMNRRFGVPYVLFERNSTPETILKSYQETFSIIGKPMPEEISRLYSEAVSRTAQAAEVMRGGTYFSGNTALRNYELHEFLTGRLGMKPLLLQISDLNADTKACREEVLKFCDPYVTRAANIGALNAIFPVLKPDYNIGAGNAIEMRKSGTVMVRFANAYNSLGFEVNRLVTEALLQAHREHDMVKAGMPANIPPQMAAMMKMKGGAN